MRYNPIKGSICLYHAPPPCVVGSSAGICIAFFTSVYLFLESFVLFSEKHSLICTIMTISALFFRMCYVISYIRGLTGAVTSNHVFYVSTWILRWQYVVRLGASSVIQSFLAYKIVYLNHSICLALFISNTTDYLPQNFYCALLRITNILENLKFLQKI